MGKSTKNAKNHPLRRCLFYTFALSPDDMVAVRPRVDTAALYEARITLPDWAEDQARIIARDKGWDYHALRAQWFDFAAIEAKKGNPPKNPGAAFVAYCKKQKAWR